MRGKRGVGFCKSIPGAVRPFERLKARPRPPRAYDDPPMPSGSVGAEEGENKPDTIENGSTPRRMPGITDLILPKWQREQVKVWLG